MPELPEVETVKRGLNKIIKKHSKIKDIVLQRKTLRNKIPAQLKKQLKGQEILTVERRAKYLLWRTSNGTLLSHLGMTGTWRVLADSKKLHDHVILKLSGGLELVYNDPRRFGILDYVPRGQESQCKWLTHLGPEPLSSAFNLQVLLKACAKRKTPLKNTIMDQKVVVGVGNIYASEALFLAGINPQQASAQLTQEQAQKLVAAIKAILRAALRSGGTTIRDFKQAGGSSGYFQRHLHVYGKSGQECHACGTKVKVQSIGGRSTFWCPYCQK